MLEGTLNRKFGQEALQCPGLPQAKHKPEADLTDENCGLTRENKSGICEAEKCAVVEVEETLLLCRLNCVHNCDDHSSLDFKIRSSIYETFHISLHIHSSRAH